MTTTYADFVAAEIAKLVPLATTPDAASGYGSDLVCVSDIDPSIRMTDPARIEDLAQDAFHRITTPRGNLPDDSDYGIDVSEMLSSPDDATTLIMQESIIRLELLKDDRYRNVDVTAGVAAKVRTFTIQITPEDPALRTFTLIVPITQAGATLEVI